MGSRRDRPSNATAWGTDETLVDRPKAAAFTVRNTRICRPGSSSIWAAIWTAVELSSRSMRRVPSTVAWKLGSS